MLITGSSLIPTEITNSNFIQRDDLQTTHEEPDLIMVQQAYKSVLNNGTNIVSVLCDDTDVLILLSYYYWKLGLNSKVYVQGISEERKTHDIKETVKANEAIMPSIVAAHALSGCDTVAPYGICKMTFTKILNDAAKLKLIGDMEASVENVIEEAAIFISDCYGFKSSNMTQCRVQSWYKKKSKARKMHLL